MYQLPDKMFDIEVPIADQIPQPSKDNGVIYLLYCSISKKGYVGQAANYVSGNKKWGTEGRWQSHVSEATGRGKDHSVLLNQAIRKYGRNAFIVMTIIEVPLDELDDKETYYIDVYNTFVPNGYNLEKGGRKNKIVSAETRKKLSEALKGKKLTLEQSRKRSRAQLGVRRSTRVRNHPEDQNLPKYISSIRKNGELVGYKICFPVGINRKDYELFNFHNSYNPREALDNAESKLAELKLEFAHVEEAHVKQREERLKISQQDKLVNKFKKRLPEYIFPIIRNNKLDGYYVDGYPDHNDKTHPKKEFTTLSTNRHNLLAAKRYLKELDIINKDKVFIETIPDELRDVGTYKHSLKRSGESGRIPKYLAYIVVKDVKIGYQINNFPLTENEKVRKKFCDTKISLMEKYKQATDFLIELWKKKKALSIESGDVAEEETVDEVIILEDIPETEISVDDQDSTDSSDDEDDTSDSDFDNAYQDNVTDDDELPELES